MLGLFAAEPEGRRRGLDEHDQHHGQRRQTTGISQPPGPRGEPAQSFPGYDVRQHGVVEHRSEGDADIGDHHARQGERRRSDRRSGEPQQRRGNDADKREAHDPRLAAPADIGDGAQRRAQQGNDQSARADGIAPDRLAPDLVADDRDREIGREDKGDDQRGERRVRPIEQRPRELTDAIFLALANGAPGRGLEAKPLLCPLLASTRWIGPPISITIIFRDLGSPRLDLRQASVRHARYG